MAEPISPQALSELIGSIYDCTLDPARWEQTLAAIADALAAESLILSLNDLRRDCLVIDRSVGWERSWLDERERHLPEIHTRLSEWLSAAVSIDEPFVASRHLPPSYFDSSPYVQHCLKPLGIADVTHFFLMYSPSHFSELVVARHQRQGIVTDREIQLGRLLLPHLRRAVTISNVLDAGLIQAARMTETLDAASCGVILTDIHGAVLHLNRAADQMLQQGRLTRDGNGILRARTPAATRELHGAIRQAANDEAKLGAAGLAVLLTDGEGSPVVGHVLPMAGGNLRPQLRSKAVAAVFIAAELDEQLEAQMVAKAFCLTPAETRLLASLLAGRTLSQTSAFLGIAATTARSHIDSIFRKTGISRQAELTRLAARLAPPTRLSIR